MNPFIVKKIIYPVHESLVGRNTMKFLRELEKSQWLSSSEIKELQFRKLKNLLIHAYTNVPYYKRRFDNMRIAIDDIKSINDIGKLPLLSREDIRGNLEELIARNWKKRLFLYNTGGSTGHPLIFYKDRQRAAYDMSSKMRARRWWDIDLGDKEVLLWGSPVELSKQDKLKTFRDRLMNVLLLSAFDLTPESILKYLQILKKYKPKFIYGYATVLYRISKFAKEQKMDMKSLNLRAVISTAEVLHDHYRELISEVFNCSVVNEYGARDGGLIAHECPQNGMHITDDCILVEILDVNNQPVKEGEIGDIVITHLEGYGMPFIRYKIGDRGSLINKKCSCGRGLSLIKMIEGRNNDFIVTKDGRFIHCLFFIYIIREIPGVAQFRIIQKSFDELQILIVKEPTFDTSTIKVIEEKIKKVMDEKVKIEFEFKEEIPLDKSGKYRWIISEVAPV